MNVLTINMCEIHGYKCKKEEKESIKEMKKEG